MNMTALTQASISFRHGCLAEMASEKVPPPCGPVAPSRNGDNLKLNPLRLQDPRTEAASEGHEGEFSNG